MSFVLIFHIKGSADLHTQHPIPNDYKTFTSNVGSTRHIYSVISESENKLLYLIIIACFINIFRVHLRLKEPEQFHVFLSVTLENS